MAKIRTKEEVYSDTDDQMDMMGFEPQGESIDPISGNEVPLGGTAEGVRDDVEAWISKGEMVIPEYAVNYHGVESYINSIQNAKKGYTQMQDMGLVGNPDEAIMEETEPLPKMDTKDTPEFQTGGLTTTPTTVTANQGQLSQFALPKVGISSIAQTAQTAQPVVQPVVQPVIQPVRPVSAQYIPPPPQYFSPSQYGMQPMGGYALPETTVGGVSPSQQLFSSLTPPPSEAPAQQPSQVPIIAPQPLPVAPGGPPGGVTGAGGVSAPSVGAPSISAPAPSPQAVAQAAQTGQVGGMGIGTGAPTLSISDAVAATNAANTISVGNALAGLIGLDPSDSVSVSTPFGDVSVDVGDVSGTAANVAISMASSAIGLVNPMAALAPIAAPLAAIGMSLSPVSVIAGIISNIANHESQTQMAVDQATLGIPNTGVHSATGYSFHAVPSMVADLLGLTAIAVYNEKDPTAAPESVDVALANMARRDGIDTSFMTKAQIRSMYGLIDENGLRPNNIAELTATDGVQGIATSEGHYRRDGTFMSKYGISATGTAKSFSELSGVQQAMVVMDRQNSDIFGLTAIDQGLISDAAVQAIKDATTLAIQQDDTSDKNIRNNLALIHAENLFKALQHGSMQPAPPSINPNIPDFSGLTSQQSAVIGHPAAVQLGLDPDTGLAPRLSASVVPTKDTPTVTAPTKDTPTVPVPKTPAVVPVPKTPAVVPVPKTPDVKTSRPPTDKSITVTPLAPPETPPTMLGLVEGIVADKSITDDPTVPHSIEMAEMARALTEENARIDKLISEMHDEDLEGGIKSDTLSDPLASIHPLAFRGAPTPTGTGQASVDPAAIGNPFSGIPNAFSGLSGNGGVGTGGSGAGHGGTGTSSGVGATGTGTSAGAGGPGPDPSSGSTGAASGSGQASAQGQSGGEGGSGSGSGGGGTCFIAGTLVMMADGTKKKIEDVKIGETLLGQDNSHNKVIKYDHPMLDKRQLISINNSKPFMTPEHPIYTRDGWKSYRLSDTIRENPAMKDEMAGEFKVGDEILNADGEWIEIKTIEAFDNEPQQQLYNFILDGNNTYYADSFLVHNKIICTELNAQGLIPTDVWKADVRAGEAFPQFILDGYHLWAKPVVKRMRKSKSFSRKVQWAASPVFYQIAAFGGCGKWSVTGLSMLAIGLPICAILGAAMLPFKQTDIPLITDLEKVGDR